MRIFRIIANFITVNKNIKPKSDAEIINPDISCSFKTIHGATTGGLKLSSSFMCLRSSSYGSLIELI